MTLSIYPHSNDAFYVVTADDIISDATVVSILEITDEHCKVYAITNDNRKSICPITLKVSEYNKTWSRNQIDLCEHLVKQTFT